MVTERRIYRDPSESVNRRVEDLLKRMSLEEKVGQLQAGHPMCYGYRKRDGQIELTEELKVMLGGAVIGQLGALLRTDPFWVQLPLYAASSRF